MNNNDNLAVYIHWPWCKKKCPYCDFNSHVSASAPVEAYVDSLLQDLDWHSANSGKRQVSSIFFGGGTPSLMPAAAVDNLISAVDAKLGLMADAEITLEANPTSVEASKFADFAQAGVNRISIGLQNMDPEQLKFLGREHSPTEALDAFTTAQKFFNNVNLDIIYGLPHENFESWQQHVKRVLDLKPHHISAYQLTIEPNTQFYKQVKNGLWSPLNDAAQSPFFEFCRETFETFGYVNYEISNFAKPGFECRHNKHIWQYGDYLGIGAGAHGRWKSAKTLAHLATRAYKMPDTYIQKVSEQGHGLFEQEELSPQEQLIEQLLLGLRLKQGVPTEALNAAREQNVVDEIELDRLINDGFVCKESNRVALSASGWPYLDEILGRIIRFN